MIDKLSFLKVGLDGGGSASAEDERLMQLFQNRAGLKKAYADLKDEFHLLRDRLKQQEGATIRLQEQLDTLGELLADSATGYGALVFYQLRALWKTCHQRIGAFAAELATQQEARETAKHRADCEAERAIRRTAADERFAAAAAEADAKRARETGLESEFRRLNAFWHYFRRRALHKTLIGARDELLTAEAVVGHLHAERRAIDTEASPPFPGISLNARRNINLAMIGYAEVVCEHVDAFGLTLRTKEAMARRVQEMNFGGRADCEGYMQRVQKAMGAVVNQRQVNNAVRVKLERLRATCEYRNSADTVPTADSLAYTPTGAAKGTRTVASPWNVLAEDYWDLYTLLLR